MTRAIGWPLSWLAGCFAGAVVGHDIVEPGLVVLEIWLLVVAGLVLAFVCAGGRHESGADLTWSTDVGGSPWQPFSHSSTRMNS